MKKSFKLFLLSYLLIVLLTGCSKKHNRSDVISYIETKLGLKGYELSDKFEEVKDSEGYTDYYWHVKYKDIEFNVIDNYYYSMESISNSIMSDYEETVIKYYINKTNSTVRYEKRNNNASSFVCAAAYDDKYINDGLLYNCYTNLKRLLNNIDFDSYPIDKLSVDIITGSDKHVIWLPIYENEKILNFDEFKNKD